jgi:hypothetical protein
MLGFGRVLHGKESGKLAWSVTWAYEQASAGQAKVRNIKTTLLIPGPGTWFSLRSATMHTVTTERLHLSYRGITYLKVKSVATSQLLK